MKDILDLSNLLKEGKISQAEYDKLKQFSLRSTSTLAFNLLVGFGVIAVSAAAFALIPTPVTAIVFGIIFSTLGILLLLKATQQWDLLTQIFITIGALVLCGGILWFYNGLLSAWIIVTLLLIAGAIAIQHGLLTVLAVLSLSCMLGAGSGYSHATYMISIEQPTLTIIVFTLIAIFAFWLSKQVPTSYERIAIIASRTSIFLVNFGFWVGSLWGDRLPHHLMIPDWSFAALWAICLVIVAIWAVQYDKRWVLNVTAVFAAIDFYTQWFERLGASPITVLIAGIIALVFAFFLRKINKSSRENI